MLGMVVFFIAFRWIHLSTPLIRLFLLVLILLLMPTLNFVPGWFALSLVRFRLRSRLDMMFILWLIFLFSSRRRHTRLQGDWSSDVCSSDLERRVRGRIEQPRQQPVEVGPGRLLRVHFLKSKLGASERFSIMSTTRQSPHICRRRRAPSPANIEWPPSLPSMLSTIRRVPNGLPQRTQWNGSASFSVTACFAWGPNRSRGTSSIASSGQVSAHRPHCTQLRSMKRSRGASAASSRAPSGHAPMQALHSVQVCLLTARAPNGAPAGSLISSIFLGAFTAR